MVSERRDPLVITRPFYLDGSDCGYCRCEKTKPTQSWTVPAAANIPEKATSITIGCQVEQMSCTDYDEFMNLGFRRSGNFLYKGDMLRSCCRMYTIRTKLSQMEVSKEHRHTVNKFKRAIADHVTDTDMTDGKSRGKKAKAQSPPFSLSSLIETEKTSSRFHTVFEPAKFSEEKYALYRKYQMKVHNDSPDKVTKSGFKNFLCDSPFLEHEVDGTKQEWDELNSWVQTWTPSEESDEASASSSTKRTRKVKRVGPAHECYYLDGKLIAISVMDFLPTGVSSVYLIWDPDYAHLSLGTLSALREVQMCHELGLGYYYLGYYIEDCEKMRYKKKFGGEVLDVCNEAFVPLEKVRPMFENDSFWVITEDDHEVQEDSEDESGESESEEEESEEESDSDDENDHHHTHDGEEVDMEPYNGEGEHELNLTGKPVKWNDNLINVADEIYGSEETYKVASTAETIIRSQLNVSSSELPPVLPGVVSLPEIVSWLSVEALDLELPVTVFSPRTGRLHECGLGELGATERGHVIDFLRLFGLERTQEAIIIA